MLGDDMLNATDYFTVMQQRIDSMTTDQLTNMTRAMARVVDVDSLLNESPARAAIYTPRQRRQPQRTNKGQAR